MGEGELTHTHQVLRSYRNEVALSHKSWHTLQRNNTRHVTMECSIILQRQSLLLHLLPEHSDDTNDGKVVHEEHKAGPVNANLIHL